MSWFEQSVYMEWARQKGILNPPTTATRLALPSCNIPVSTNITLWIKPAMAFSTDCWCDTACVRQLYTIAAPYRNHYILRLRPYKLKMSKLQ